MTQKRIRDVLRLHYGTLPVGSTRWELTEDQVRLVREHFADPEATRPWESSSTQELLTTYAEILAELRQREVVRTANAPLGDYAEYLAAGVYGGTLANNSVKSYDLISSDGRRIQVKARTLGAGRSAVFSVFRSFDFDVATLLAFSAATYELKWARELSPEDILEHSRWSAHVNGHLLAVARAEKLGTDVTKLFDGATSV